MIFELAIGGVLFWALLLVALVLTEYSVIHGDHWGFLWFALFFGILWWSTPFNALSWSFHNFGTFIAYLSMYVVAGIGYSFIKWYFYLRNKLDRINANTALRDSYTTAQNDKINPFKGTFTDYLTSRNYIPLALDNKTRITVWMVWWPFSAVETFFGDIVRRAYDWVIDYFMKLYDKINDIVFGSLNNS